MEKVGYYTFRGIWLVEGKQLWYKSQIDQDTFWFRQLREQRLEKCGLCPITLHFSRPLIGGRQATVVQKSDRPSLLFLANSWLCDINSLHTWSIYQVIALPKYRYKEEGLGRSDIGFSVYTWFVFPVPGSRWVQGLLLNICFGQIENMVNVQLLPSIGSERNESVHCTT